MDIDLPKSNGIFATKIIGEQFSQIKVVIYSNYYENHYISQSLEAGAKGYFLKNTPIEEVVQGIRNIHKGFCQFSPDLLENYVRHIALSKAQEEVLLLPKNELETSLPVKSSFEAIEINSLKPNFEEDQPKRILVWVGIVIAALGISALAIAYRFYTKINDISLQQTSVTTPVLSEPTAVSALGRIEPEGEVIQLSVSSAAEASKIDRLLVERGDQVQKGQVVAILDNYGRQQAVLESAQADVQTAQANLERVLAGAKQGDINAQKASIDQLKAELKGQVASQQAAIARLDAELKNAEVEYRRYQQLFRNGAISDSERDTKRLRVDTLNQQLSEAKETLNRTIDTTQVQLSEAQAKLESIAK